MKSLVLGALASVLSACAPAEVDAVASEGQALLSSDGRDLAWILDPVDMPPGHIGTSNCVYAFGGRGCNLGAHPDSGCWERDTGHDGWIRQQIYKVHCDGLNACGGGPGDAYAIRICRGPGESSPCGQTGPNGCAVCQASPVCD